MDSGLITIMIICATIIAIVAIFFDYMTFKLIPADKCENLLNQKIVKLHRNYIAGILGVAVVMLLTAKYGQSYNRIFEYISFASTVTSLVLSVLAIFVTVKSNADLYSQFAKIEDTHSSLSNVATHIKDALDNMEKVKVELTDTSKELNRNVGQLVQEIVEKVRVNIKDTEKTLQDAIRTSMPKQLDNNPSNVVLGDGQEEYIHSMSYMGLLALYACCLSYDSRKQFNNIDLFASDNEYVYGILVASVCAGVISINVDKMSVTCSKIIYAKEMIIAEITQRINAAKDEEEKQELNNLYSKISEHFENVNNQ